MKIKEIKLYGFKSFREETKVLLNTGVTAFVGPNGSGKSNIFDALRWVFGEQSMKALRCERIEDLVYVSPDSKEDSNFTEVAVVIDNEDYFPQFGSEFEIKRRFYRTGESEFFLNRVKCRLQDIQALFLNSGALTYSFLELAEVERIIHGDTKQMFDDVAGILKYQERKEQTKRRLAATEQDLLRLEDIILEMQRGLRSLKRQVRQARLYNELRAEYKNLALFIMVTDYRIAQQEIKDIQSQVDKIETERQSVLYAVRQLENEREELKKAIEKAKKEQTSSISQITQVNEAIEALQARIEEKEEEVKNRTILAERYSAGIKEKQDRVNNDRRRLSELEDERNALLTSLDNLSSKLQSMKAEREAKDQGYFSLENSIKENEKGISDAEGRIIDMQSELVRLRYDRENKENLLSQMNAELTTLNAEVEQDKRSKRALEQELEEIAKQQNDAGLHLQEIHKKADELEKKLGEVEEDIRSRSDTMVDYRIMIDTLKRRLQAEGKREIENKFGARVSGMFKDSLEVEPGYEAVVDICLSHLLDFYLLNEYSGDDFLDSPDGRFGFIDVTRSAASMTHPELQDALSLTRFVKLKSSAAALASYVGRYFVIDDHEKAREYSAKYPAYGFVTKRGVLFRDGTIIVEKGDVGFFRVTQSLDEYKEKLESLKNEVLFMNEEKKRLGQEFETAKAEIEKVRNSLFSININKSECSLKLLDAKKLTEKREEELGSVRDDRDVLLRDSKLIAEEMGKLEQNMAQVNEQKLQSEAQYRKLEERMIQMKREMDDSSERMNGLMTEKAVLEGRENMISKSMEQVNVAINTAESEIRILKEKSLIDEIAELNDSINALKGELALKRQEKSSYEAQLPARLMDEYNKRQSLVYDQLAEKQKDHESMQDQIMQLKYKLFEKNHRRDDLARKADEECGVTLHDYAPEEEITDAHNKIAEVKGRIEKLGQVNPLSLEAYEEEKKRLDEFLGQRDDIIAAKKNLLRSIEELDQRARDRFNETFQDVREQFNYVFANFFEDGQADLILTEPENPLASKVEIVVRMMGRRLKTINQLSGGQKTLLAISLLLAFYLVKPAPFCILDEIDAPLDDINVVRFNKFLRDLSQRTQVVIITHNRATMEYADYLYGLTMEKPRESKVISAKLADLEKITTLEE
jgi:chromosome segregation protein